MSDLNIEFTKVKRRMFDKVYAEKLNPEQRRAVFTAKGPLLILAGAGSGKTTVLVNRIAFLIQYGNAYMDTSLPEGVSPGMISALSDAVDTMPPAELSEILPQFITEPCPPWAMLAITFTNKAANEIKDRLAKTFSDPSVSESIWAGTFHAICMRILHRFGDRVGYRDGFSIYDTDDSKRLIIKCMEELRLDPKILQPKAVAIEISRAKDHLLTPEQFEITRDPRSRDIQKIYALYQKKLMDYNAMDFDDIIVSTVRLLEREPEVLSYYQNKFRYVCVDEYQDTNYAQFRLTELLAGKYRNIMVVGDDDQSIYKFRGATVENILDFDKTYPDATVIKLEQNYRSTETILEAANAVIGHNDHRHGKKLWSDKGEGEKIRVYEAKDGIDEGKFIVSHIQKAVREGAKYSDFAVLYRINEMARSLENTFNKSGMPYRIIGAQRFTDRKEIRDILAYLYLIRSHEDDMRLMRIINVPKRKIGDATVEAVEAIGKVEGLSMFTVMERAADFVALAKSVDKLGEFCALIRSFSPDALPSVLIPDVFDKSGYRQMLEGEGFEGEGRILAVEEFVSAAVEYERRCADNGETPTLSGFLEEIELVADVDKYDDTADAVVLMTVHSAKGLEFPTVFLAGMEDGIFPSQRNIGEPDEMQEERRLAYVAITRAKKQLYVTHAKERLMYGRSSYNPLSSFVREEIPKNFMQMEFQKKEPPRGIPSGYSSFGMGSKRPLRDPDFSRPVELFSAPKPKEKPAGPAGYGISKMASGTRVEHAMFGAGEILSAKELGGDILYEIRFDSGVVKKLMATYANLKPEEKS